MVKVRESFNSGIFPKRESGHLHRHAERSGSEASPAEAKHPCSRHASRCSGTAKAGSQSHQPQTASQEKPTVPNCKRWGLGILCVFYFFTSKMGLIPRFMVLFLIGCFSPVVSCCIKYVGSGLYGAVVHTPALQLCAVSQTICFKSAIWHV